MTTNKVLAVVGGKPITDTDVENAIYSLGERAGAYQNAQGRQIMLEQLINKELVLTDAKKNLLEMDPEFKEELAKLRNELLVNFYVEKVLREVKLAPGEEKKYFDEHPEEFQGEETVNASHILVESAEKANSILAQIRSGEIPFEEAAKSFSSCPSAREGGSLGDFAKGQMVPEFDAACFSMQEGEIAGPVKTQFGYHLIRLNKKNPAKAHDFEEVKDSLKAMLLRKKQQAAYESKMRQLRILYPVDQSGIVG